MTSFVSCLSPDFWTSNFFLCACGCCSCIKLCFFCVISLMFFALSSPLKNFSSFSLHRSSFSVSVGLALYNFVVGIFVEFELWECVHLFCPRQCFLHSYVIATWLTFFWLCSFAFLYQFLCKFNAISVLCLCATNSIHPFSNGSISQICVASPLSFQSHLNHVWHQEHHSVLSSHLRTLWVGECFQLRWLWPSDVALQVSSLSHHGNVCVTLSLRCKSSSFSWCRVLAWVMQEWPVNNEGVCVNEKKGCICCPYFMCIAADLA